jgi:hypothetical protein
MYKKNPTFVPIVPRGSAKGGAVNAGDADPAEDDGGAADPANLDQNSVQVPPKNMAVNSEVKKKLGFHVWAVSLV